MVSAVLALSGCSSRSSAARANRCCRFGCSRNRTFTVTSTVGFIVGFALFGSVTYLPVFLQVVKGASANRVGHADAADDGRHAARRRSSSGQLISRTGRYKVFPVIGTAVMTCGLVPPVAHDARNEHVWPQSGMLLLGLGLGMVMQVLVIAVQNAVDYRDLGVATSGATLFRLIGGSRRHRGARRDLRYATGKRAAAPSSVEHTGSSRAWLGDHARSSLPPLSPTVRAAYAAAFSASLTMLFAVATAVALVGFLLTWLLPERPLRATISAEVTEGGGLVGEAFAMPVNPDSLAELRRGLASLANREAQRQYIETLVARSERESPGGGCVAAREGGAGSRYRPHCAWPHARDQRVDHRRGGRPAFEPWARHGKDDGRQRVAAPGRHARWLRRAGSNH